jgi:hypothetical protein
MAIVKDKFVKFLSETNELRMICSLEKLQEVLINVRDETFSGYTDEDSVCSSSDETALSSEWLKCKKSMVSPVAVKRQLCVPWLPDRNLSMLQLPYLGLPPLLPFPSFLFQVSLKTRHHHISALKKLT